MRSHPFSGGPPSWAQGFYAPGRPGEPLHPALWNRPRCVIAPVLGNTGATINSLVGRWPIVISGPTWSTSRLGPALKFSAAADYVDLGATPDINVGWCHTVFEFTSNVPGWGYRLWGGTYDQTPRLEWVGNSYNNLILAHGYYAWGSDPYVPPVGVPQGITVVWNKASAWMYLNGVLITTSPSTYPDSYFNAAADFQVGNLPGYARASLGYLTLFALAEGRIDPKVFADPLAPLRLAPERRIWAPAGGGNTIALTGSAVGAATAAATLIRAARPQPLAGTATGAATAAATEKLARALLATATGAATAAATQKVARQVTGSAAGAATGTVAQWVARALRASGAGTATASATQKVGRALAASSAGQTTAAATQRVARSLVTAASAGVAVATAMAGTARTLVAYAAGAATATASAACQRVLRATSAGQAAGQATARAARALSATTAGQATVTGSMGVLRALMATAAGACTSVLALTINKFGSLWLDVASGQATAQVSMALRRALRLTGAGASEASGTAQIDRSVGGSSAGQASGTASIGVLRRMLAAAAGVCAATATIATGAAAALFRRALSMRSGSRGPQD